MDEVEGVDVGEGGEAPQSNMVLRKRIKRIRAGMKKYNTQLDEVKRFDQSINQLPRAVKQLYLVFIINFSSPTSFSYKKLRRYGLWSISSVL